MGSFTRFTDSHFCLLLSAFFCRGDKKVICNKFIQMVRLRLLFNSIF